MRQHTAVAASSTARSSSARRVTPSTVVAGAVPAAPSRPASTPALALLTAGSRHDDRVLGLGPALASAMRKVLDALPEGAPTTARDGAQRFLVEPETDLLSRGRDGEALPDTVLAEVRRAVLAGRRLRLHYAATDRPAWRTVDPLGLVTSRGRTYRLATRDGADRTYRVSRVLAAEELADPAQRPARLDLEQLWRERDRFLADGHLAVRVRVHPGRRDQLLAGASAVRAQEPDDEGWWRLEVTFEDARHGPCGSSGRTSRPSRRTRCARRCATGPSP